MTSGDETPVTSSDQPLAESAMPSQADVASAETAASSGGEKKWFAVKVQSGREDSIRDAVERRVKIEGLDAYVGKIVVPVERTTEIVKGKKVTRTRKLYPGYIFVEVEFNDKILYLFRETPGVGDFVGAGVNKKPIPMPAADVQKLLQQREEVVAKAQVPKIKFDKGERVKIKDGMFAGMEGEISNILEAKGRVEVMLKVFGREVPVEHEYWQIEHV